MAAQWCDNNEEKKMSVIVVGCDCRGDTIYQLFVSVQLHLKARLGPHVGRHLIYCKQTCVHYDSCEVYE